ncbi:hypothetical protein AVO44_20195 [Ruegeria profundi]|uniref:Uncharacterized protein n=1 Tax=Ruegeria profundi TaxID=1685378 RepID=A0A0X3TBX9_9RHOB|nr:hypothetical protein AVO44_20195 [Ruegeria profundi]
MEKSLHIGTFLTKVTVSTSGFLQAPEWLQKKKTVSRPGNEQPSLFTRNACLYGNEMNRLLNSRLLADETAA